MSLRSIATALLTLLMLPLAAHAQTVAPPPIPEADEPELVEFDTAKTRSIAVPALVAPAPADTPAGNSAALGRQIAEVISSDLRASGVFETQGPNGLRAIALGEVTAPQFDYWKGRPVEQLVQGFVRVGGDGSGVDLELAGVEAGAVGVQEGIGPGGGNADGHGRNSLEGG